MTEYDYSSVSARVEVKEIDARETAPYTYDEKSRLVMEVVVHLSLIIVINGFFEIILVSL